jgi:hypothetical protein
MLDHTAPVGGVRDWDGTQLRRAVSLLSPRLVTRVVARVRRLALDQAIADGADVTASPQLAARAVQLATPATRSRIASGLELVVLTADGPRGRLRTPPLREAIRANRARLMALASMLRHGGLLYARGIAVLELVLIDGTGPAYTDPRGEGLARQLQLAAESLTG